MQYLFDETGRRYLDVCHTHLLLCLHIIARCKNPAAILYVKLATENIKLRTSVSAHLSKGHYCHKLLTCVQAFAGIVTVSAGHCHPKVNEAIQNQMIRLQHTTTIYLNDQIAQYGKEMAAKMPGKLKVRNCAQLPSLC